MIMQSPHWSWQTCIRIACLLVAAGSMILIGKPAPADAQISLVSPWQHCEPIKGCIKIAFFPNGWAVEQFPLAGRVVTAYGRYHVRGTVLKIGWKRYEPTEICVPISDRKSGVEPGGGPRAAGTT